MFDLNTEIKVADLLTVGSIFVATAALLSTWLKDRRLREREYADRVRRAASRSLVALERWSELFCRLFNSVQPLITDADALIVQEQNAVTTRDTFWRHLVAAYASVQDDLSKEGLEGAYVDLYAFDPAVYDGYSAAITGLKEAGRVAYACLRDDTQSTILTLQRQERPVFSAELGNRLRADLIRAEARFAREGALRLSPFDGWSFGLYPQRTGTYSRGDGPPDHETRGVPPNNVSGLLRQLESEIFPR